MAICWNSYRHHLPTSLTDITYRHHLPTSLTDISYRHLLPTMVFQHSKTSRLPTFTYLLWFFSIQKPVVSSYNLLFISHMRQPGKRVLINVSFVLRASYGLGSLRRKRCSLDKDSSVS